MAIDKNKTIELLSTINGFADTILPDNIPADTRKWILGSVFGPAMDEIKKLVDESRPPVIFLMGRSGHGKSSIINALANKKVAKISEVKPGTMDTTRFEILFEESHSTWTVYDSRGYFETNKSNSEGLESVSDLLKKSIIKCKPDVILHIISMTEVKNLKNDINIFKEISHNLFVEYGATIPTLIVLNNSDLVGDPDEWPPENNPFKSGLIKEHLDYLIRDILKIHEMKPLDNNNSIYGFTVTDNTYIGAIPACALWEDENDERWNINTLIDFIGNVLPDDALLYYSQANKRKKLLKKISTSLIRRFTTIASTIGANPIPIGDIYILSPLQILLVSIIAGLSCRDINKDNYKQVLTEFSASAGVVIGGAMALREGVRWILDLTLVGAPVAAAVSGAIAGTGTYTIGKLAESYFFNNEIRNQKELNNEAKDFLNNK